MKVIYDAPKPPPYQPRHNCRKALTSLARGGRMVGEPDDDLNYNGRFELGSIVECTCGKMWYTTYHIGSFCGGTDEYEWSRVRPWHYKLKRHITGIKTDWNLLGHA